MSKSGPLEGGPCTMCGVRVCGDGVAGHRRALAEHEATCTWIASLTGADREASAIAGHVGRVPASPPRAEPCQPVRILADRLDHDKASELGRQIRDCTDRDTRAQLQYELAWGHRWVAETVAREIVGAQRYSAFGATIGVEEAEQAAFDAVHYATGKWDPDHDSRSRFSTYANRAAKNAIIDLIRAAEADEEAWWGYLTGQARAAIQGSGGPTPTNQSVQRLVRRSLDVLDDREQRVLRAKHVDKWTWRQIAKSIGRTDRRAKQIGASARERFRAAVIEHLETSGNDLRHIRNRINTLGRVLT